MKVHELIALLQAMPQDIGVAIRGKDDFLLIEENMSFDPNPYFGNCSYGDDYVEENGGALNFLVLSTGQ